MFSPEVLGKPQPWQRLREAVGRRDRGRGADSLLIRESLKP